MAKLLVALIALSTLGFLAYHAMYSTQVNATGDDVAHAPKRQLDNVREKAHQIEANDQKYVDELQKKSSGE
jgi:hypothetical protein